MLSRRVVELCMPMTLDHILRTDGWTPIFGRPSRRKTIPCTYWTKRWDGWHSHSALRGSMVAEQHQDASPDISTQQRRSIMVLGSIA